jgi:signal peptidase II
VQRRYQVFCAVAAATFLGDQITKVIARRELGEVGAKVTVIDGFFDWRLSYNTGSAFGLFRSLGGARVWLSLIGVVAILAILWMLRQARNDQRRLTWALALVAGGAVGNVLDRMLYGKVTDFVLWHYHGTEWPTFNVADAALVVGVGLLFLDLGKDKKAAAAAAGAEAGAEAGKT